MFNIVKKELEWCGKPLTLETGRMARQADGAVLVTYGKTVVLGTAVSSKTAKEGIDFLPLTVNYQEKAFAAGKIPGGFFKREGRPSEAETLTCRLIDRPIRPLFPEGFFHETQVICTVLSHDPDVEPDIPAMVAASAALAISGVPFLGPIGGIRVGFKDGKYISNPSADEICDSDLDLVVAGTKNSVLMVESEANILSEDEMLGAVEYGHKNMQPVIKLIEELKSEAGKPAWDVQTPDHSALKKKIEKLAEKGLRDAYKEKEKQARSEKISDIKASTIESLTEELGEELDLVVTNGLLKKLEKDIVRGDIIKSQKRIDDRGVSDVRSIDSQVSVLPKTHGSALFTRGETQALAVTTLGTGDDMQRIDSLGGDYKEHFLLHYNFPPFSVGEASMLRPAGRREIGHGRLAWRALHATMPSLEEFPYTIRIVSDITESNGSSSMATVCGGSLSMMDAGVPVTAPVAGIAMGLIKEEKDYVILSDILGDEDHLGDMDFKVAGTDKGITALQMDIKIDGITTEIMKKALKQAKEGRLHILKEMKKALSKPRKGVNENAPQIVTVEIDKEKIGGLIGPGGKNIREICEVTGAKIDIEEDGSVNIAAVDKASIDAAVKMVEESVCEPEVGKIYDGKVVKILDFGLLVNFLGKSEGMVHISEISGERIEDIHEVSNVDDEVKVKVISSDRGKTRLSMRVVDQKTGDDISDQFDDEPRAPAPRNRRDNRGGRDGGGRGGNNNRRDRGGNDRDRGDRNNREERNNRRDNDGDDKPSKRKKRFF